jgi:hypothetical protein
MKQRRERRMAETPLFLDHHKSVEGLTADAVADAHRKDVDGQSEYGVVYHRYWFNEDSGEVFASSRPRQRGGRSRAQGGTRAVG